MARKINFFTDKIVIYARVSTDEQGRSGLGLEAQISLCQRYADTSDKEIIGIFQEVISGTVPLKERTEFSYALLTAQKHGASLVVAKLDRLARDVYVVSGYLNRHTFGAETPPLVVAECPTATEFELNLRASLAQEERRLISSRTKAALQARKNRGEIPNGTAGRAIAHEKARTATKDAYSRAKQLLEHGYSYQSIADILNQENFRTSRGSSWSRQSVYERLKRNQ